MIHKIPARDLLTGMYVVDLALSPQEFPHVYAKTGLLDSPYDITALVAQGFLEAFIDDEKSVVPIPAQHAWADPLGSSDFNEQFDPELDVHAVRANLEQALSTYANSVKTTKLIFGSIQKGKELPLEAIYTIAGSVVESLMSDSQALVAVTKLQTYDDYTFTHCVNVSVMATMFGRHLGMAREILYQLAMGGLLHDIGKVAIPYKLLNTARRLSNDEFEIMKKHALLGYEILQKNNGISRKIKQAALEHHERHNGSGYPMQKKGMEISMMGRMISIVDVYDALTSKRVYKPALTPYTAVSFLYSQRGESFAPPLVDRFIQCVGIYPAGSLVSLSSGETGIVCRTNPQKPLLPTVIIIMDSHGAKCPAKILDLGDAPDLCVQACQDPAKTGINSSAILKSCALELEKAGVVPEPTLP